MPPGGAAARSPRSASEGPAGVDGAAAESGDPSGDDAVSSPAPLLVAFGVGCPVPPAGVGDFGGLLLRNDGAGIVTVQGEPLPRGGFVARSPRYLR